MANIERITEFELQVVKMVRSLEPRNKLIVEKFEGDTAGAIEVRRKTFIQESGEEHDISKTD